MTVVADGDVYTWGHGGRGNFLRELIQPGNKQNLVANCLAIGPLGHGVNTHRNVPTAVEALRGLPRIQSITTGNDFCFALNGTFRKRVIIQKPKTTSITGVEENMVFSALVVMLI